MDQLLLVKIIEHILFGTEAVLHSVNERLQDVLLIKELFKPFNTFQGSSTENNGCCLSTACATITHTHAHTHAHARARPRLHTLAFCKCSETCWHTVVAN
jgi:hypothetical protein